MMVPKTQFSTPIRILLALVLGLILTGTSRLHAATVWNGSLLTYNQPAPNPTLATNQDRLTADVWLTRGASKGLFNAFYETNATALSPTNTEWAFGSLTNHASLSYTNWLALLNGASPTTLVGQPMVLHLISDDIYLSLKFTFWAGGGSGGFAYQRSTPEPVVILSGTGLHDGQFTFTYNAIIGQPYVVQNSTNLVNWVPLVTNVALGSPVQFSNTLDSTGPEFYRVGWLPAP